MAGATVTTTSGCFRKGDEGYRCRSSKQCNGKLRCKQFYPKGKLLSVCVGAGKSSVSSKEIYGNAMVYLSWGLGLSIGAVFLAFVALVIRHRRRLARGEKPNPPSPTQPPRGAPP